MPIRRRKATPGRQDASPAASPAPHASDGGAARAPTTPRYLAAADRAPVVIQRQHVAHEDPIRHDSPTHRPPVSPPGPMPTPMPGPVPPAPSYQLQPPSLLQPRDPYARYMPDFGFQLRLDPELEAAMRARAMLMLSSERVLAGAASVAPVLTATPAPDPEMPRPVGPPLAPTLPPSGSPAAPGAPGGPSPTGPVAQNPASAGPASPRPGPVPSPDAGKPRRGSGGDVLSAVLATPQVKRLVDEMRGEFTGRLSSYWEGASTGERAAFVGSSVLVGGAVLAPVLGFEGPRDFVLPLVNDVVLPIPGLAGYGLQFHIGERDVMVGAHIDVGLLLPSVLGFGPASFEAIPPGPNPGAPPPVSRKEAPGGDDRVGADLARDVQNARAEGIPLGRFSGAGSRMAREAEGEVRIHSGGEGDRLARRAGALAFTSGRDIFFRAGSWDPGSPEGARLLAHELAHVEQQGRGELPPGPPGAPLRMGTPGDALEREADRIAGETIGVPGAAPPS